MVTTLSPGPRAATGSEQERWARPFTCTVHEPHWATPQPYLVPVSPAFSRNAQRSGVSGSTSRSRTWPFTLIFIRALLFRSMLRRGVFHLAAQDLADVGLRQLLPEF